MSVEPEGARLTVAQVLEPLARHRTDEVVVTTMSVVRPWGSLSSSELDFASADSAMGHAADLVQEPGLELRVLDVDLDEGQQVVARPLGVEHRRVASDHAAAFELADSLVHRRR